MEIEAKKRVNPSSTPNCQGNAQVLENVLLFPLRSNSASLPMTKVTAIYSLDRLDLCRSQSRFKECLLRKLSAVGECEGHCPKPSSPGMVSQLLDKCVEFFLTRLEPPIQFCQAVLLLCPIQEIKRFILSLHKVGYSPMWQILEARRHLVRIRWARCPFLNPTM